MRDAAWRPIKDRATFLALSAEPLRTLPPVDALTVVAEGTYTDGRRGWKVFGGRLGRSYVLESSADGKLWTPVRTNRVAEGAYHHVSPAGGNVFVRVKP